MNINILHYSLYGIAGGQEIDHTFVKFIIHPLTMIAFSLRINIFTDQGNAFFRVSTAVGT